MAHTYYTDTDDIYNTVWADITTSEVSADQMLHATKMAYNRINSYLEGVYTVPFTVGASCPMVVRQISDDLSTVFAKWITSGHGWIPKGPWRELYDSALAWLDDLRTGKAQVEGLTRADYTGATSSTLGYEPIFDLAGTDGLDDDYEDAILDARGEDD